MTEQIALRIYSGSGSPVAMQYGDGTAITGGALYSVAKYVRSVTSERDRALANKLASYGARSMTYFGYTAWEEDVSSASWIAAEPESVTSADLSAYRTTASGSRRHFGEELFLTLETLTSINLLFALDSGRSIGEYTFLADGVNVSANVTQDGSLYRLTIPDIAAKELDTEHTVRIERGGEALTLTCSALSYAYNTLVLYENRTEKTALCELVRSLYAYNRAADVYFAQ